MYMYMYNSVGPMHTLAFVGCCLATKILLYMCWLLPSNQNFKDPYLEPEVVEEVMGRLG